MWWGKHIILQNEEFHDAIKDVTIHCRLDQGKRQMLTYIWYGNLLDEKQGLLRLESR
jgi:hypothetical protein